MYNFLLKIGKICGIIGVIGLLILTIGIVQKQLTAQKSSNWNITSMAFLPDDERLRNLLLGFHTTFAAYLWIRTTLYFGEHAIGDKQYPWLTHMVDMVTKFNRRFIPAYVFAGLMIPDFCEDPNAARVILERGIAAFGSEQWNLPFYQGWLYYTHYQDKQRAAEYLTLASQHPNAPQYIRRLATVFFSQSGYVDRSKEFLVSLYHTTDDPDVKEHLFQLLQK